MTLLLSHGRLLTLPMEEFCLFVFHHGHHVQQQVTSTEDPTTNTESFTVSQDNMTTIFTTLGIVILHLHEPYSPTKGQRHGL